MDFLKKNYEKIILIVVLLGVVGFLAFLPFVISGDKKNLDDERNQIIPTKVKALPELNMDRQEGILQRLRSPVTYDYSTGNRLFNPLLWKRNASGEVFPIKNGNEIGAAAAVVTKIAPLYLVITLDSVETNSTPPRYVIGLEHQAAATLPMRRKQTRYAELKEKKDSFTLEQVLGDPLNPDEIVLTLADTGEKAIVKKDKPFQRVDAYAADLKYDPEKKTFPGRRVGATISFNGDDYIIVAIDANDVVLSSQSNQKKTTLPYTP